MGFRKGDAWRRLSHGASWHRGNDAVNEHRAGLWQAVVEAGELEGEGQADDGGTPVARPDPAVAPLLRSAGGAQLVAASFIDRFRKACRYDRRSG